VYVDPAFVDKLDPIGEEQDEMLGATAAERKPNSRLSCQIRMKPELTGLIVRMPDRQY
jgi:2Fe-2S ferredoxin